MGGQTDTSSRNLPATLLRVIVVAGPALLAVVLALRPMASFDIGYHLAYGDHFLRTGRIVQTNRFIYTKLDKEILSDPANCGPGATYDPVAGVYRFVNANWLSQVVMAAVHRFGGMSGLVTAQAVLVGAIFALLIVAMRRMGMGLCWAAPAAMLAMLGAYPRFNLRPELFGYLILVAQWCILIRGDIRLRGAAGLIALQVLAVNFHSYFMIGIGLAGAMLIDAALRWVWRRVHNRPQPPELLGRLRWLGAAAAGMTLACLINPWFLRGALMPFEALHFLISKDILARTLGASKELHPWATITELISPFHEGFARTTAGKVYVVVLILSGAAVVVAALRRRWGWLLVTVGVALISVSMERNTAPAALILIPTGFVVLRDGWAAVAGRLGRKAARPAAVATWAAGAATVVAAAFFIVHVTTQRLYFNDRRPWRFGSGISRLALPVDAARWINEHQPAGDRLFCDYDSSSNLLYLTHTKYQVPVLTNTWAVPPYVMAQVLRMTSRQSPFRPYATEYGINAVVIRSSRANGPLMKRLEVNPYWTIVQIHTRYIVFVRSTEPTGDLAERHGIAVDRFDVDRHAEVVAQSDPVEAFAFHNAALLLYRLAWGDKQMAGGDRTHPDPGQIQREIAWARHAAELWERAIRAEPEYREAIMGLCYCRALIGTDRALVWALRRAQNAQIEADARRRLDWSDPMRAQRLAGGRRQDAGGHRRRSGLRAVP